MRRLSLTLMSTLLVGLMCVGTVHAAGGSCKRPRVMIVLDKSSSMNSALPGGQSKWAAAKSALSTILTTYQATIDFGLLVFPSPAYCAPGSVKVGIGPKNATAIMGQLITPPPASGNWTPMAQSLDAAGKVQNLQDTSYNNNVLLITDGWQWCSPYVSSTRFWPVTSATKLKAKGISTYVVGFGDSVDALTLNKVADVAGTKASPFCNAAGTDPKANTHCYYKSGNNQDLLAALKKIALAVSQEICDGKDNDCDGTVDGPTALCKSGGVCSGGVCNKDSDGDGLYDGQEDKNGNGKVDAGETDPKNKDSDGDGLVDGWVDTNGNKKWDLGEGEDKNLNGKQDSGETDPLKWDTDGGCESDGSEEKAGRNPLYKPDDKCNNKDTDGDGLPDKLEDKNGNGKVDPGETDPLKKDTDGDGIHDGVEDRNRNGKVDTGETDPTNKDSDGDGLTDGWVDANKNVKWDPTEGEDRDNNGKLDAGETDPLKWDTDGGCESDGSEEKAGRNPLYKPDDKCNNKDTDGDGLPDKLEDKNGNGKVDPGETDPLKKDTDGDGLSDGVEDANKNGKKDSGETDPTNKDTDGDGLPDGWVDANKNGKWEPGEGEDRNNDGKKDPGETDPRKWDTDGGGENDGSEVTKTGHNPLDPKDDNAKGTPDGGTKPTPDGGLGPDTRPAGPVGDDPDGGLGSGYHVYGGAAAGCSVADGTGQSAPWALLVLGFALVFASRRRKATLAAAAAVVVLTSTAATAQPVQMAVNNFKPVASPTGFYVTEDGELLPHLAPAVGLLLSYAHHPLELYDPTSSRRVADLVSYQVNMDLVAGLALWNRVELGLALPVALTQGSDDLSIIGREPGTHSGGGVGDLRITIKGRLATAGPITLALAMPVSVPTGDQDNFLGEGGVTFTPKAVVSLNTSRVDVGINAGYRLRGSQTFKFSEAQGAVEVDDEVVLSLGVRVALWKKRIDLIADGFMGLSVKELDKEELPAEVMGGLRFHLPHGLVANLGAGPGLSRGVGTPIFRAFAGLGYVYDPGPPPPPPARPAPPPPPPKDGDRDKDGIIDSLDKCPDAPEDKDQFQDQDGCPDVDNDQDGVLDRDDACPNRMEDPDQFEDHDGCPDPDNDQDKILDDVDRCPLKPEVYNGVDDEDGCPDKAAGPVQIDRGKITVPPVFFATNKARILQRSHAVLLEVANTLLRNNWVKKVRVEGHTDSRGPAVFNKDLSRRRALSVRNFLIEQGVAEDRLTSDGFGAEQPIADNRSRDGRSKNRRVDFVILDPKVE